MKGSGKDSRRRCDLCREPITFMTYRGRDGEYCSNECFEKAERKESQMATKTTKTKTAPAAETPSKTRKAGVVSKATAPTKTKTKKVKVSIPEDAIEDGVEEEEVEEAPAKKVAKKTAKKAAPAKSAAPVKKTAKKTKASVDVESPFREGTANDAVFQLLADEEVHTLEECYEASTAAGAKWPKDALWFVQKRGKDAGTYEVVTDRANGTVQLTFAR